MANKNVAEEKEVLESQVDIEDTDNSEDIHQEDVVEEETDKEEISEEELNDILHSEDYEIEVILEGVPRTSDKYLGSFKNDEEGKSSIKNLRKTHNIQSVKGRLGKNSPHAQYYYLNCYL